MKRITYILFLFAFSIDSKAQQIIRAKDIYHWPLPTIKATSPGVTTIVVDTTNGRYYRTTGGSGGGGSQNLQQTTDIGDTTNRNIKGDTLFSRVFKNNSVATFGDTLKGNKKLYTFGTSITKGSSAEGFPIDSMYQYRFAKRYGLTVVNRGTGGSTMQIPGVLGNSDSAMVNMTWKLPLYSIGDWWIFEFGVNDAWNIICPACDTTAFKIAYNRVLDTATVRGTPMNRIILKTPIPSPNSDYFPRIANYASAVRSVAAARGCWLSDDYVYLTANGGNLNFNAPWGDDVHPNTTYGYENMYKTLEDLQLPIKQVGEVIINGGLLVRDSTDIMGNVVLGGTQKDYGLNTGFSLFQHTGKTFLRNNLTITAPVPGSTAKLQIGLNTSDIGIDLMNLSNSNRIYTIDATNMRFTNGVSYMDLLSTGIATNGSISISVGGFRGIESGSFLTVNPDANQYGYFQAKGLSNDYLIKTNPLLNKVGINFNPVSASDPLLTVSGRAKVDSFTMTTGATNGYVLTSDGTGKGTWQAPAAGTYSASTYTPTLTNTTNISASTASVTHYIQIGDLIHVWGQVSIDATTALSVAEMGLSLPSVATAISNTYDIAGTASFEDNTTIQIKGDVANGRAKFRFTPQTATNNTYSFHFTIRYYAP